MSATQIKLEKSDGWWVATDTESGVASQGETREDALEMLDEALELHGGVDGDSVTDNELREMGIDPDRNRSGDISEYDLFN